MTEPVGERLEDLEKSVRRAAEVIVMLRKERESLQAKLAAGEADRAELQRLRHERKEMLGQINALLKEMEKLDLGASPSASKLRHPAKSTRTGTRPSTSPP